MFCLKPNPEFDARVFLTRLGEDAPVPVQFKFRHKTAPQVDAWIKSANDRLAADWLMDVVIGWKSGEVCGEDGQPVSFSRDALAELLNAFGAAGDEIFQTYLEALRESRRKN